VDDLPVFTVKSEEDCHLTVINVDGRGEGTVLFPNTFDEDNFLAAGKELQIPGSKSDWQFRLKDPGVETVIAICNATGEKADGIKHDFATRQFTPLGNYRDFLTRQIVVEGAERFTRGQKAKLAKAGGEAEPAPEAALAPGASASDILARTAIKLVVN
jgi:hypothetical protein